MLTTVENVAALRVREGCWLKAIIAASVFFAAPAAATSFDIQINFGSGLTSSQEAIFAQAESTWEFLITGYSPGVTLSGVTIDASAPAIDGAGGILGQAGPTLGAWDQGYLFVTEGVMEFDSDDLLWLESSGSLRDVILHEMGHVLGFGTVWTYNGLYDGSSGVYTGSNALGVYRNEFNQPLATGIPVELDGGAGTAHGHWDENYGGSGNTGLTNPDGVDMKHELMTGWLNAPTYISRTTIYQFMDLGYTVIPEPGTGVLLALGLGFLARRRMASSA